MVEKHMTEEMDVNGNQKMDWFFNEYVYGTALPTYKMESSFDTGADGDVVFNFKITQSNVDDKFTMLVPLYLELADGNIVALGRAKLIGNSSMEQKVPLKGLKTRPKRALINYYDDVLASPSWTTEREHGLCSLVQPGLSHCMVGMLFARSSLH